MPKFKCTNKACEQYNQIRTITDVVYKWDPKEKSFRPSRQIICVKCDSVMEEVTEQKSLASINFSYQQQIKSSNSRNYKNFIY